MALFHVSHPPWLRPVGMRTSYIHFSNISWTPRVLDPITNPFLGPSSWLHPASVLICFCYAMYFKLCILHSVGIPHYAFLQDLGGWWSSPTFKGPMLCTQLQQDSNLRSLPEKAALNPISKVPGCLPVMGSRTRGVQVILEKCM